ncbi:Ig-like domain-containing protein [Herbiconiux solani]|uniref:Ig-like domain-containing protein n=1 Tax=Herbiconiux solani TaxID=661329 RepID=UPI0008247D26|nr:Ig-like domain-containing protein [Herbiconiux solani]
MPSTISRTISRTITRSVALAGAGALLAVGLAGFSAAPADALMPTPVCEHALGTTQQVVTGLPTRLRTTCHSQVPRQLLAVAGHGTVSITPAGVIDYTSADGYLGTDVIRVIVPVGGLPSIWEASFTVEVVPEAVAGADSYEVAAGARLAVGADAGLLQNDSVPTAGWLIQRGETPPAHGSLALDTVTGSFVYQPDAGFTGTDRFLYRLTGPDQDAYSNVVAVTFLVR